MIETRRDVLDRIFSANYIRRLIVQDDRRSCSLLLRELPVVGRSSPCVRTGSVRLARSFGIGGGPEKWCPVKFKIAISFSPPGRRTSLSLVPSFRGTRFCASLPDFSCFPPVLLVLYLCLVIYFLFKNSGRPFHPAECVPCFLSTFRSRRRRRLFARASFALSRAPTLSFAHATIYLPVMDIIK